MFDPAPVSPWLEDHSALKALFLERWRGLGVADLRAHLSQDPRRLQASTQAIRIVRVNQHTLDLFHAPNLQTLQERLGEVFRGDTEDTLQDPLLDP